MGSIRKTDAVGVKHCPTCREALPATRPPAFPFCSERCRMIDLGRWLDEDYRIPDRDDDN